MISEGQDKNTLGRRIQRNDEPEEEETPTGEPTWKRGE